MVRGKFMKKMLVCALALSLSMASATVVNASSMGGGSSMGGSSMGGGSNSEGGSSSTQQNGSVKGMSQVVTGGKVLLSTIGGQYGATNVNGVAVITPKASINTALGVKEGETATVRIFKSFYGPLAQKCLADTATALNMKAGPVLDITMGKVKDGKFTSVQEALAPLAFTVGIPDSFKTAGSIYYVINIQPGGKVVLLSDTDSDPNTVTFETTGFGVFAIVK